MADKVEETIAKLEELYAPKVELSIRNENPPPIDQMAAFCPDVNARTVNFAEAYVKHSDRVIEANRPSDKIIIAQMKTRP